MSFRTIVLMMFVATAGAKTPPAEPAAGGAAAQTPEELDAMAVEHQTSTDEHKAQSVEHFEIHKASHADMEHETTRAELFGDVEMAHVQAADAHSRAAELAKLAAESRARANEAAAARDAAKELLSQKETDESEKRATASAAEKKETQTQVVLETKTDSSTAAKVEMEKTETTMTLAKEEHKKVDTVLYFETKTNEEAAQTLATAEADAVQKGTIMDEATANFDKATETLNLLLGEETELNEAFGAQEANSATKETIFKKCEQDRASAKAAYDEALAKASALDAAAVRAEARAQDTATTAGNQAAAAKAIADTVAAPAGL